jgi:hypothetical protein
VTPDDDFESFRGTLSHLDTEAEQRIRRRFEQLRDRGSNVTPTLNDVSPEGTEIVELEAVAATDDVSPRHTHRVLMGMAAAAALLALIGIVTLVRNADDTADVASGVDGVPLTELANRAANQPDLDLLPGQYLYRSSIEGASFDAIDALAAGQSVELFELWLDREGTGLRRINESRWTSTSPGTPQGAVSTEPRDIQVRPAQPFFNPSLTYAELRALPTDPEALYAAARRTGGDPSDPAFEAQTLSWWLAIETTPPAVRAAAFEALAQLGAEPIGSVTTYNGQDGFGYQGAGEDGAPWIIVIDAASTRVLAFARGAGAGDALWTDATRFDEYGDQWIVDALPS